MTPAAATPEEIAQLLQQPLLLAAEAGFARPPGMTVEQYLALLVQHRVADAATVGAYAALYQQVRYGGRAPDAAATAELCHQLRLELAVLATLPEERRAALAAALAAPPVTTVAMAPPPLPEANLGVPPALPPTAPPPPLPMVAALPPHAAETVTRQGIDWPRPIVLLVLIFWSLAMLYLGHAQSRRIGGVMAELRYRLIGPSAMVDEPISPMREFAMRRRDVMSNSNDLEGFRRLAHFALQQGRVHDAQVCYYYLIARDPHNAEHYNELAWLLLTADDWSFRDPPRALPLAEKAYSLAPLPYIADTLAMAVWQNGDRDRAIRLQQDAIAMTNSEEEREVFRRHLAMFEHGPYQPPSLDGGQPGVDDGAPSVPPTP